MEVEEFISSVFIRNPLWDQKDAGNHYIGEMMGWGGLWN